MNDILLQKGHPSFTPGVPPHLLGSLCRPPEERRLSIPEIGEKERNYYLFKSYTDYTHKRTQSFLLPFAQSGVLYPREEVEVRGLGSQHHLHGKREHLQSHVVPENTRGPKKRDQMAATPGFKSQRQSSSAAPFPAPPTIGHSCQHSWQLWPSGVEPIISKLFWNPLQIPVWAPLLAAPCYTMILK